MTRDSGAVRVFPGGDRLLPAADADALASHATAFLDQHVREAVDRRGRAVVALAGGGTPRETYSRLAALPLPWESIDLVLGDERLVSAESPDSNHAMCSGALGTRPRLHPVVPSGWDPGVTPAVDLAADHARRLVRLTRAPEGRAPVLDVVILGLGSDGHVASLFPGSPALGETGRWAVVAPGPAAAGTGSPDVPRITITLPVLEHARRLLFLVSGESKAQAMAEVLEGNGELPAALIPGRGKRALWVADRAAASRLTPPGGRDPGPGTDPSPRA